MESRLTGTGLDRLVEIIETDEGLRRYAGASDVAGGAEAARGMNALIVEGITSLGLTNDGSIDASDLRALSDWVRADAGRYETFAALYGTSRNGVETGFQLVERDGGDTRLWGEGAVNEVADAIYSFGFGDRDGRLFDVDGHLYRSVALTASWLDRLLSDADMKALSNPDVVIQGTTGTGLDRLIEIIDTDPGLRRNASQTDIVDGAKAADALNHMILDGIRDMGLVNDGSIDAADLRALGDWAQSDATRRDAFLDLYGTNRSGQETGFQLVEQEGSNAQIWGEGAINEVADAIYSFGFGYSGGRLLDVDGDLYRSVALTASWLDDLLSDTDMAALGNSEGSAVVEGTTGTGLDRLIEFIKDDSGLMRTISRQDIADGARAADAMNHMYLDGIRALGLANDGVIDSSDVIALGDWISDDAGRYADFLELHGSDEGGVSTGWHLVLHKGGQTAYVGIEDGIHPHRGHIINHAMKGIYQIGYGSEQGRLLNDDGNPKITVRIPADWFDQLLTNADMKALSNPDLGVVEGTTGTGLDRLIDVIDTDPGLAGKVSRVDIAEGAKAADALNHMILDGIRKKGLADDGTMDADDLRALGDWVRADAGRNDTFLGLYGTSKNGVETGFQLIEQEGSNARLWGEGAINEVADAIYSFGFGDRDGRLLDVNGDLYRSVALTAGWIDNLLNDADMAALSNSGIDDFQIA